MKTIIITRHAKSSWDTIGQTDFDRTLNERGIKDAPMMGERLFTKNINIDSIISSNAARASQTARHIASAMNIESEKITYLQDLYHAPPSMINDVIKSVDDRFETIMIVCHNPGITNWVNLQMGHMLDNMPTCGMICFKADCSNWHLFNNTKKEFVFFDFPKNENGHVSNF